MKKKKKMLGDCYQVAANYVVDYKFLKEEKDSLSKFESPMLVHGEVCGQGDIAGVRYGHAWVEIGKGLIVIDKSNGNDIQMMAKNYYKLAKATNMKKYTPTETAVNLLKYKHYGSWENNSNLLNGG